MQLAGWVAALVATVWVTVLVLRVRRAEARLERSEQEMRYQSQLAREVLDHSSRLGIALDSLPVGMVLSDRAGNVVLQNGAALEVLEGGARRATIDSTIAEMVADLYDGEDRREPVERVVDFFGPPAGVLRLSAALIVGQTDQDDAVACIVIEDVTDRHRVERVRRDFVANISHELRTPIGAIGLIAETVRDEISSSDPDLVAVRRLSGRACDEVDRVSRTIEDLTELSHIEFGDQSVAERLVVGAIVGEAVARVRGAAQNRSIELDVSIPDGLEVVGDRRQLVSAMFNLLDNALKYSPQASSVEVLAEVEEAAVEARVRLSVRDRGIGIPSRDLDRIFERFYRVDRARSRGTGGTGLGLAIVRHVVENHGGTVGVISKEGEGSTFTLELPLAPTATSPAVPGAAVTGTKAEVPVR